jgi:hypothetical protein
MEALRKEVSAQLIAVLGILFIEGGGMLIVCVGERNRD